MLQSVGYNTLPLPMNLCLIDNKALLPLVEKIIEDQLPQLFTNHMVLYSCRATFIRKNDLKNAMIILLSNAFVILDLDIDTVYDVINLERITPIITDTNNDTEVNHSTLFSFKLEEQSKPKTTTKHSDTSNEYKISSRTRQYVQDTNGYQSSTLKSDYKLPSYDSDSSSDGSKKNFGSSNSNMIAQVAENETGGKNNLSFFIDEISGKYLLSYVMLLKQNLSSKDLAYLLFDLQ